MLNYKFLIMDNQKRIDKGNVKLSTHNSKLKTASTSDPGYTSCPFRAEVKIIPAGLRVCLPALLNHAKSPALLRRCCSSWPGVLARVRCTQTGLSVADKETCLLCALCLPRETQLVSISPGWTRTTPLAPIYSAFHP